MIEAIKQAVEAASNEYIVRQTAWGASNEAIAAAQKEIDESDKRIQDAEAVIALEKSKAVERVNALEAAQKNAESILETVREAAKVKQDLETIVATLTVSKS